MAATFSPSHLFHHLLLRPTTTTSPPPSSLISIFFRPIFFKSIASSATTPILSKTFIPNRNSFYTSSSRLLLFCSQSLTSHHHEPSTAVLSEAKSFSSEGKEEEEDDDDDGEGEEIVIESVNSELEEAILEDNAQLVVDSKNGASETGTKQVLNLTVKEKKELASYAHSLGKKLKIQSVGKSGFNSNVATSFMETLEANELLKIKIHRTCPGELEDVLKQLEEATGSVVVGKIGRTVIIYKPSVAKLKAEEKRRQLRRVYVRKGSQTKPMLLKTTQQVSKQSGRGRRGSSRL